LHNTD